MSSGFIDAQAHPHMFGAGTQNKAKNRKQMKWLKDMAITKNVNAH